MKLKIASRLKCGLQVKASSLVYAVFILFIITLIAGSIIMVAHFNKMYYMDMLQYEKSIDHLNSGINLLLADQDVIGFNQIRKISLYGGLHDSVTLSKSHWGLFPLLKTTLQHNQTEISRCAISGGYWRSDSSYAIYLPNNNKALSLCGSSQIKGPCWLSEAGLKKTTIDGIHFSGQVETNGKVFQSIDSIPVPKDRILQYAFDQFTNRMMEFDDEDVVFQSLEQHDTLTRSFLKSTILYVKDEPCNLSTNFQGNIIIYSEDRLLVPADIQMKEVILIAPVIEFEAGFKGTLQAFASDSIIINNNCTLIYPSAMVLLNQDINPEYPIILVEPWAEINGIVYSYVAGEPDKKQAAMRISDQSQINGQVYSNRLIEHHGAINGSICCEGFILFRASGLYINYLFNANIDFYALNSHFTGIDLFTNNNPQKVIKWLY